MPFPFAAVAGVLPQISQIFIKDPPTPEEQKTKAGVWYIMLQDFARDTTQDTNNFANRWETKLPFTQKSTKQRFMRENIRSKSSSVIVDNLIRKINDELTPDFPPVAPDTIKEQVGLISVSPTTTKPVSGGTVDMLVSAQSKNTAFLDSPQKSEVKESNQVFFGIGILVLIVGVLTFVLIPQKKRR